MLSSASIDSSTAGTRLALAARGRDAVRSALVDAEERLDQAVDPLVLRRRAGEDVGRAVARRQLQALHEVLAAAPGQVVERGEQRLARVSTGTPALAAICGHVVAWMPWLLCSSSVHSMIRSRVGSTSRGSPGMSRTPPRSRAGAPPARTPGCVSAARRARPRARAARAGSAARTPGDRPCAG